jgi:hypothetical protein
LAKAESESSSRMSLYSIEREPPFRSLHPISPQKLSQFGNDSFRDRYMGQTAATIPRIPRPPGLPILHDWTGQYDRSGRDLSCRKEKLLWARIQEKTSR